MTQSHQPIDSSIPTAKSGFSWSSFCLDSFLVLLVAGTIGYTAYLLNHEMTAYKLPSPMIAEKAKNRELLATFKSLEEQAYRADANLRFEERLSALKEQSRLLKQQLSDEQAQQTQYQELILAQQDALKAAEKDARRIAHQQIRTGLHIGSMMTRDGQRYEDCTIRRATSKSITISHSTGQSPFSLERIAPESLPQLVRFALGMEKLIDTSDFVSRNEIKEKPVSVATKVQHANIELLPTPAKPAVGAPVIDTAPVTPASNPTGNPASSTERWVPTNDPLPL